MRTSLGSITFAALIALAGAGPASSQSPEAAAQPVATLRVVVTMARDDGPSRPVPNAPVELMDSEGRSWSGRTDDRGGASLGAAMEGHEAPRGEIVLAAKPSGCGHALARRLQRETGETTMTLDLGQVRKVALKVVEPFESSRVPVIGALVELQAEGHIFVKAGAMTDVNGKVEIGCVPRGAKVRVRASMPGYRSAGELLTDADGGYVLVIAPDDGFKLLPLEGWRWFPKFG